MINKKDKSKRKKMENTWKSCRLGADETNGEWNWDNEEPDRNKRRDIRCTNG